MKLGLSRRGFLGRAAVVARVLPASGQLVDKEPQDLKPGEYTWNADLSPDGVT